MTIILNAGDTVRAATWAPHISVEVGTVEQFAASYREDPARYIARAIEHGHDLAWTSNYGTTLYGDTTIAKAKMAEAKAKADRAFVLKAGDEVEIEGRLYTVRFPQKQDAREYPNLSDPIHFVRAP